MSQQLYRRLPALQKCEARGCNYYCLRIYPYAWYMHTNPCKPRANSFAEKVSEIQASKSMTCSSAGGQQRGNGRELQHGWRDGSRPPGRLTALRRSLTAYPEQELGILLYLFVVALQPSWQTAYFACFALTDTLCMGLCRTIPVRW